MTLAIPNSSAVSNGYVSAEKRRFSVDRLKDIAQRAVHSLDTSASNSYETDRSDLQQLDQHNFFAGEAVEKRIRDRRAKLFRSALRRPDIETCEQMLAPQSGITGMRKWEGRIVEVDEDYFSAELVPFGEGPVVIADFTRDKLDEEPDLQPGDVVYLTTRTVRVNGGSTHTSSIRLRRLGRWTVDEVADQARRAREQAKELATYIDE